MLINTDLQVRGALTFWNGTSFISPAGGVTVIDATIDIGPDLKFFGSANIVDAGVTLASKILVDWGTVTDADYNHPEMDNVVFYATPNAGSVTIRVASQQPISGLFKIRYQR